LSKKIINFTPTGTQTTRDNSLAPLTATEIIEECHEAFELGITLVHLHARDENLENTYKINHWEKIISGLRTLTPELVICVSLSGRYFQDTNQRTEVLQLKPDMGSLTLSSMNFQTSASINSKDTILELITRMNQWGVIPELECFDTGMINFANYLISKNILSGPHYFNVILGNMFNSQCELTTLSDIKSNLPDNSICTIGGIGPQQLKSNLYGLLEFDGVRVGLEDNLYYRDKQKTTNIKLLNRIKKIMSELDLELLKSSEFRKLGYENTFNNR